MVPELLSSNLCSLRSNVDRSVRARSLIGLHYDQSAIGTIQSDVLL